MSVKDGRSMNGPTVASDAPLQVPALSASHVPAGSSVMANASNGAASWRSFHWAQVRDLLRELIARDIKLRCRGSLLGIAWTLLKTTAYFTDTV